MDKIRGFHQSLVGADEEQEEDFLGEFSGSCSLSPVQSLIVFYRPVKFAVLFSFGNLLAIGSTAFLIGPVQQTRMMLDPVRFYASAIYVGSVVLALICALWIHNKVLTLIAIISEICALIWYSLSYVPFARRMVSELLISCCDTEI
ncbi:vesicle transport protein SFT2B-like isoform X2 [Asparagus officinalis]|uniref:vesicle transport protein SFT2B-like isoform X2 n=1 Tax=Asparagus officinalis TaxID=4686 RepID=UPI00098E5F86|nr:vesicle transport protein SFT2B-like isoform X2 [Asparagus officinalis]